MGTDFKEIARSALNLSEEMRAELATLLLESLHEPIDQEIEKAWTEELKRRIEEVESGEVSTIPAETVMKRAREKLNSSM